MEGAHEECKVADAVVMETIRSKDNEWERGSNQADITECSDQNHCEVNAMANVATTRAGDSIAVRSMLSVHGVCIPRLH